MRGKTRQEAERHDRKVHKPNSQKKSDDLFNLVTKVVVEDKVKNDLCDQSEIGRKLVDTFCKRTGQIQQG